MTDKEKLREIKIEQEPTQVTWRRCTQCNGIQMEFQLREDGICQKCYISNLEKDIKTIVNAFNNYECSGTEQEQTNTWEILTDVMHEALEKYCK